MTEADSLTGLDITPPKADLMSTLEAVISLLYFIKTEVQALPASTREAAFKTPLNPPSNPAQALA